MAKYQKYAEYKDSGVEWLGEIPSHWATCSLSKLFAIKAGGDVDLKSFSEDQSEEYPYPIYTNANNENSIYGYSKVANYQANSITVSGRGEVGFSVYRDHPFDAIIRLLVLTPQKECHPKFYAYYINEVINFRVESSAIGQLSTLQISPYKTVLPSIDEQKLIISFLDHETAKIDTLIAKQEKLIELLKEKRQAVISHAVTKGLNPNAPMKDSDVEWLGEVPEHWVVKQNKYLLEFVTSGSRGWAQYYTDSGSLFFRIANLTRDTIEPKLDSLQYVEPPKGSEGERSKIKENDLLISITADLGSVCVANTSIEGGYVSQHVALCRPSKVCVSRWLAYFILSDCAKEQFLGSGYGGTKIQLSLEDIKELIIAVPNIDEQTQISNYIDKQLIKYEKLIGHAKRLIISLQERRNALISAAVTGKIDVRNWQHPNQKNNNNKELSA